MMEGEEKVSGIEMTRNTADDAVSSKGQPAAQTLGWGGGFTYDPTSGLYHDARSGFYHDAEAGWYYDSGTGQYYAFQAGQYVPWDSKARTSAPDQDQCMAEGNEREGAQEQGIGDVELSLSSKGQDQSLPRPVECETQLGELSGSRAIIDGSTSDNVITQGGTQARSSFKDRSGVEGFKRDVEVKLTGINKPVNCPLLLAEIKEEVHAASPQLREKEKQVSGKESVGTSRLGQDSDVDFGSEGFKGKEGPTKAAQAGKIIVALVAESDKASLDSQGEPPELGQGMQLGLPDAEGLRDAAEERRAPETSFDSSMVHVPELQVSGPTVVVTAEHGVADFGEEDLQGQGTTDNPSRESAVSGADSQRAKKKRFSVERAAPDAGATLSRNFDFSRWHYDFYKRFYWVYCPDTDAYHLYEGDPQVRTQLIHGPDALGDMAWNGKTKESKKNLPLQAPGSVDKLRTKMETGFAGSGAGKECGLHAGNEGREGTGEHAYLKVTHADDVQAGAEHSQLKEGQGGVESVAGGYNEQDYSSRWYFNHTVGQWYYWDGLAWVQAPQQESGHHDPDQGGSVTRGSGEMRDSYASAGYEGGERNAGTVGEKHNAERKEQSLAMGQGEEGGGYVGKDSTKERQEVREDDSAEETRNLPSNWVEDTLIELFMQPGKLSQDKQQYRLSSADIFKETNDYHSREGQRSWATSEEAYKKGLYNCSVGTYATGSSSTECSREGYASHSTDAGQGGYNNGWGTHADPASMGRGPEGRKYHHAAEWWGARGWTQDTNKKREDLRLGKEEVEEGELEEEEEEGEEGEIRSEGEEGKALEEGEIVDSEWASESAPEEVEAMAGGGSNMGLQGKKGGAPAIHSTEDEAVADWGAGTEHERWQSQGEWKWQEARGWIWVDPMGRQYAAEAGSDGSAQWKGDAYEVRAVNCAVTGLCSSEPVDQVGERNQGEDGWGQATWTTSPVEMPAVSRPSISSQALREQEAETRWREQYGAGASGTVGGEKPVGPGSKAPLSQAAVMEGKAKTLGAADLWDWGVSARVTTGKKGWSLTGRLAPAARLLHPSLGAAGGLIKTGVVRQAEGSLVRVSSGKVYRLRKPSSTYVASLVANGMPFNPNNPTETWGLPPLKIPEGGDGDGEQEQGATKGPTTVTKAFVPNRALSKEQLAILAASLKRKRAGKAAKDMAPSDVATGEGGEPPSQMQEQLGQSGGSCSSNANGGVERSAKVPKRGLGGVSTLPVQYRDRAAERRRLYGLGTGPGQKKQAGPANEERAEQSDGPQSTGGVAAQGSARSLGNDNKGKRMLRGMGWQEGDALGATEGGLVDPIKATRNKGRAGLGWN